MQNLNHPAIQPGKLQERDFLPKGCDQQGRHPQAAEACTDVGADDEPVTIKETIVWWALAIGPLCGVIALAFAVAYGSEIADLARQVWRVAS